jgi:hypothetical protein
MFKRKTLFVLGAGASFEAGLPFGPEIASRIGRKMDIRFEHFNQPKGNGDFPLFGQITKSLSDRPNEFQNAAWTIRDGIVFAQSIDDFLDQHRSNEFVNVYGKAALAKTVLEAEQQCKLYFNRHANQEMFDVSALASTWYVKFMYMLGRGIPQEDVASIFENVAFIVFNYDRCVEWFLTHALARTYRLDEGRAASIVASLNVIHPYGAIPAKIPFGSSSADYAAIGASIKTYTEQLGADDVIKSIASEVHSAECIVFLGFAYHSQNVALLRPKSPRTTCPVFGTAFGMSDSDVDVVSSNLASFFNVTMSKTARNNLIRLENKLKCADLFDNYARSLSGGD